MFMDFENVYGFKTCSWIQKNSQICKMLTGLEKYLWFLKLSKLKKFSWIQKNSTRLENAHEFKKHTRAS